MAGPSARDVKRLFALSSNRCAYPKCQCAIAEGTSLIGEICHIKADKPGGPRHDMSQTDEERQSFENLILMCANHHKVIDDDEESFTVELLLAIKSAHEKRSTLLPKSAESDAVVQLLIDSSVASTGQSGGLTVNTVNAHTINFQGSVADTTKSVKTTRAFETLWNALVGMKSEFNDVMFVDAVLLPSELDKCFTGAATNPYFEAIVPYANHMLALQKMQKHIPEDAKKHRLFVGPRIWVIYTILSTLYFAVDTLV
jgi:hypothetical protein